jgi:hypothetical protein
MTKTIELTKATNAVAAASRHLREVVDPNGPTPLRWSEIARVALLLGLVDDASKGSMFRLSKMLDDRTRSIRTHAAARSSRRKCT